MNAKEYLLKKISENKRGLQANNYAYFNTMNDKEYATELTKDYDKTLKTATELLKEIMKSKDSEPEKWDKAMIIIREVTQNYNQYIRDYSDIPVDDDYIDIKLKGSNNGDHLRYCKKSKMDYEELSNSKDFREELLKILEKYKENKEIEFKINEPAYIVKNILFRTWNSIHDYLEEKEYKDLNNKQTREVIKTLIKGLKQSLKGEKIMNEQEEKKQKERYETTERIRMELQPHIELTINDYKNNKLGYHQRVFQKIANDYEPEIAYKVLTEEAIKIIEKKNKMSDWAKLAIATEITKYVMRYNYDFRKKFTKIITEQLKKIDLTSDDKGVYITMKNLYEFHINLGQKLTEEEFSKKRGKIINEILKSLNNK